MIKYKKIIIAFILFSLASFTSGCNKLNLFSETKDETQEAPVEEAPAAEVAAPVAEAVEAVEEVKAEE